MWCSMCAFVYLVGAGVCRRISATASLYNPPSGSSFPGPGPRGWWADPSAGTVGRLAPSHTAPSYDPQPAHANIRR